LNGIGQPDPAADEDGSFPVDENVSHGSFALNRVSALARVCVLITVHLGENLQPSTASVAFTKCQALHGKYSKERVRVPAADFHVQVTLMLRLKRECNGRCL